MLEGFCLVLVVWGLLLLGFFFFGSDTSLFSLSSAALEPGTLFVHVHFHKVFFFAFVFERI